MPKRKEDKIVWETIIGGLRITLAEIGRDAYRVKYSHETAGPLSYNRATEKLGACIFHALALEGKLDNGEP